MRATTWVFDHDRADSSARRCRFCGRGPSAQVTFRKRAHAGPELLGSKTIRTLNECDECNGRFGREFECHLGNRLDFLRSVTQVKGKGGAPSYENPSGTMRIDHPGGKQAFYLTDKSLFNKAAAAAGPFSFDLPADTASQKHVPLQAFKGAGEGRLLGLPARRGCPVPAGDPMAHDRNGHLRVEFPRAPRFHPRACAKRSPARCFSSEGVGPAPNLTCGACSRF